MRPNLCLPPELYCPGTRPSQALKLRPRQKSWPLPTVLMSAMAVVGPIPPSCINCCAWVLWRAMRGDVAVVLGDAFIKPGDFTQEIADDSVGPAGQLFEACQRFTAHGGGFEGQHQPQLREQTPNAVERGGALFHESLAGAVHHELALLLDALVGHETHLGRVTASQIAAASAASFLPRLPERR